MRGDLAGCPTFAPAYVGRKRRAKRTTVFATPAKNAGCPIQAVLWLEWDNGCRCTASRLPQPPKGRGTAFSEPWRVSGVDRATAEHRRRGTRLVPSHIWDRRAGWSRDYGAHLA